MATLRDIKRRIVAVKNTQQITKAMKMVAAAKLRKAQENIINARPYSQKIDEVLNNLLLIEKDFKHPLFVERDIKNIAVVVVTSDRGLCGSFNLNVLRESEEFIKNDLELTKNDERLKLYCIGKKGVDYFNNRGYRIYGKHPNIFSHLKFEFASSIVSELTQKFLSGDIDKVVIIYNEFKSVIQQKLNKKQFLPILPHDSDHPIKGNVDIIFEPDRTSIINQLIPRYLSAQFWRFLLESYAAELGARMSAMEMATENAKEMIRSLQITYNKERQATITKEIIEIVSGANALTEG